MANNNEISTQKLVNELEKAVDSSVKLLKVLEKSDDVITDMAKDLKEGFNVIDKKTTKGLSDFNKLLKETNKLTEESEKIQQLKIKTEQTLIRKEEELSKQRILETKEKIELNKLYAQEKKTRILVKKEQERQLALFKKSNKEQIKEIDAYQKKSKALNEARKKYKALAASQQATTKEGKALLKNITKLDKELKEIDATVGQNQRSVGKYQDAVKGLNSTIGKLGITAVIVKGVELLTGAFGDSREGALSLQIGLSKFTETAKVFINSIIDSGEGISDLFSAIGDTFSDLITKAKITGLELKAALSFGVIDTTKEIEELEKTLSKSSFSDAIDKITKAFEGNVETTSTAIKEQEKYLKLQLKTTIAISKQEKELAGLQEQRQILQDISDDDTIGFRSREIAIKAASEIAIEFGEKEVKLARLKEKLAREAVKQDLRRAGIDVSNIDTSEELIDLIEKGDNAKKVSDTNDEAFTVAYSERRDKEVESESFKRDQEEKFRKTARDSFEQELDILEEFTEQKIALNQSVIDDEKTTQEEREKLIEENKKLTEDLYNESIKLIKEQGKASIDLRKDLTDEEKEAQKLLLDNIESQEIKNEQDAQELFNIIRKLDLGEIEEKRLKEAIKLNRELTEANKEGAVVDEKNTETRKEQLKDLADLTEDFISNQLEKANEKSEKALDATQKRIEDINKAIELGNEEAKQSLAIEEKKEAELEAKREKRRKAEAKIEAGIAILKSFGANDGDLGKTIADTSVLLSFINTLPSFYDGVEDTGTVAKPLDSNGGRLTMLHDNERVLTAKQNAKLGGISNEDLADLGAMHNKGDINGGATIIQQNNKELIAEVKEVVRAVKSIPQTSFAFDEKGKYYKEVVKSLNKKEIIKTRANNLFK